MQAPVVIKKIFIESVAGHSDAGLYFGRASFANTVQVTLKGIKALEFDYTATANFEIFYDSLEEINLKTGAVCPNIRFISLNKSLAKPTIRAAVGSYMAGGHTPEGYPANVVFE